VEDIIVTGHYGCGGVKASMLKHDHGPLEYWLSLIRSIRINFRDMLNSKKHEDNVNTLC
jgi:carbonic anhydrase